MTTQTPVFPVRSRSRRWLKNSLIGFGAATLALAALGATYQSIGTALDRQRYPAPGELVSIGDHRLHIHEMGSHHAGPTVVLESGLGAPSAGWAWVQPEVAQFARVVTYDRAGLGWSDDSDAPPDAIHTAQQLHDLLKAAEIPGPYVMVGHSIGGLYVRQFTELYPDEVVGLVLVDSSHPDQLARFPESVVAMQKQSQRLYQISPLLARFGILRITNLYGQMMGSDALPPEAARAAEAFFQSVDHLQNQHQESQQWEATTAQVRATGDLGDGQRPGLGHRPLIVLSANPAPEGVMADMQPVWQTLHRELAALSTVGQHRLVDGADHFSVLLNETHAAAVTAAVREVVTQVRN